VWTTEVSASGKVPELMEQNGKEGQEISDEAYRSREGREETLSGSVEQVRVSEVVAEARHPQ
jgi:hypothetical protein